jgi:hypothetical protein
MEKRREDASRGIAYNDTGREGEPEGNSTRGEPEENSRRGRTRGKQHEKWSRGERIKSD